MRTMLKCREVKLVGDWAPQGRVVGQLSVNSSLIFNLEGSVYVGHNSIKHLSQKAGPSLLNLCLPETKDTCTAILANNHLFDYGLDGYIITLDEIIKRDWIAVGAGANKAEAHQHAIFELDGNRIGILARCEKQFGAAQDSKPGVAVFDSTIYEQIRVLKSQVDKVIVSVHAAAEMLPWPSPARQDTFRALIDAGADIIHGHHAHVPQGWEEYREGLIFYGLGNFCVDPASWSWHPNGLWSLTPDISLENGKFVFQIKTMVIEDQGQYISVRDSKKIESTEHRSYLEICNQPLTDRRLLEGIWQEASIKMYHSFYSDWLGFDSSTARHAYRTARGYLSDIKAKLLKNYKKTNSVKYRNLLHYHLFACDSHNDAISTALGVLSGELEDLRTTQTKSLVDKWMIER